MKKIAIAINQLATHGPSLIRLQIAEELVKRGLEVHIVLGLATGDLSQNIPPGCKLFILQSARPREFILKFGKYLRKEKPDAVIASSWPFSVSVILAIRLFSKQVKVVVSEHADFRTNIKASGEFVKKDEFLIKYVSKYIYRLADKVVGVSQGVVDGLCEVAGLEKSKTAVIYNPLRVFTSDPCAASNELAAYNTFWESDAVNLLAVGRLALQKDYDVMIAAVNLLKKKYDIRLIIIGEGSLQSVIQKRIKKLSLGENVMLVGKISNVDQYYSRADAFIMSSSSEGFGNVIVEALSFGLPIVSTDCQSGPAEILQNGEYGVLTPVGDVQAFGLGIEQILSSQIDPEKQKRRSRDFSIEKSTDQYLSALFSN